MPLIKCPMCEREISSNAVACPHCGEPIKRDNKVSRYNIVIKSCINNKELVANILKVELNFSHKTALKYIDTAPSIIECNLYLEDVNRLSDLLRDKGVITEIRKVKPKQSGNTENKQISQQEMLKKQMLGINCPNCSSTSTNKISMTGRVASGLTFGIFSSSIGKTWKCNKCGYKW